MLSNKLIIRQGWIYIIHTHTHRLIRPSYNRWYIFSADLSRIRIDYSRADFGNGNFCHSSFVNWFKFLCSILAPVWILYLCVLRCVLLRVFVTSARWNLRITPRSTQHGYIAQHLPLTGARADSFTRVSFCTWKLCELSSSRVSSKLSNHIAYVITVSMVQSFRFSRVGKLRRASALFTRTKIWFMLVASIDVDLFICFILFPLRKAESMFANWVSSHRPTRVWNRVASINLNF